MLTPRLLAAAAVLSVGLAGAPLLSASAATTPTAASVIAAATSALQGRSGVHLEIATLSGGSLSSSVADVGLAAGKEVYKAGADSFSVAVTKKAAYLKGSRAGLTALMGLTKKQAATVGKSWIVMKKGSSQYKEFWLNLTAKAFTSVLPAVKGTTLLAKRDPATHGYQLVWTTKATSSTTATSTTLIISAGAKALPLREVVTSSQGSSTTSFSKWGERVTFSVPTKTVAYSTVFG